MLARAGQDVHFLLRSDYEAVRRDGLKVLTAAGDFLLRPSCARTPEEIGPVDLVLIGLKTTANDQFPKLIPPLVGPGTAVLTLQNGLGNEESLAAFLPARQVMGGLCFVCLNRIAPGVIQHVAHGLIMLGEFGRPPEPRTETIAALFRESGVPCKVSENLARAHWEKLVWNVPFNGLGVAAVAGYEAVARGDWHPGEPAGKCHATDALLGDPRWESLVKELMMEIIATANALGLDVPPSAADHQMERTRSMGAYLASTLIDYDKGLPLEINSLFQEPLRQAVLAGVPTPRLENLCRVLTQIEARGRNAA